MNDPLNWKGMTPQLSQAAPDPSAASAATTTQYTQMGRPTGKQARPRKNREAEPDSGPANTRTPMAKGVNQVVRQSVK